MFLLFLIGEAGDFKMLFPCRGQEKSNGLCQLGKLHINALIAST